jgi:unsaturated chondroitin disaccharide hydrolase
LQKGEMMIKEKDQQWLNRVVEKISIKMDWVSEKSKDKIPYTTLNGTHDDRSASGDWHVVDGLNWWTNGFWGGMMWQMYHETGNEKYAKIAQISEQRMDQCFVDYYGLHHDVGCMWLPTAVTNYKITGNSESAKRAMHAANLLAGRFNPVGKFIRAWNGFLGEESDNRGWAIIDCLINIPLLYWAYEETQDPRFKQIAMIHADTVMETFIRPDGSCNHIVEFDPFNGGIVKTYGGQGYGEGSSWTRGQTWALYGFVMSYIHTGKVAYLDTAKRIAHYFISNIPESGLIPIDFRQPKEPTWEDSAAAAIAACGLIEIAKNVNELEKDMYLDAAVRLLKALDEKRTDWSRDNDCILTHCSVAYHSTQHHLSLIYADYFFMEAIFKLKGDDLYIW